MEAVLLFHLYMPLGPSHLPIELGQSHLPDNLWLGHRCFVSCQKKMAAYPLIPHPLFTSRSNVAALPVGLLHGISYFAASYYLPLYFQAVISVSALALGLLVLPFEISFPIFCAFSGISIKITCHYLSFIYPGLFLLMLSLSLLVIFIKLDAETDVIVIIQILGGLELECHIPLHYLHFGPASWSKIMQQQQRHSVSYVSLLLRYLSFGRGSLSEYDAVSTSYSQR